MVNCESRKHQMEENRKSQICKTVETDLMNPKQWVRVPPKALSNVYWNGTDCLVVPFGFIISLRRSKFFYCVVPTKFLTTKMLLECFCFKWVRSPFISLQIYCSISYLLIFASKRPCRVIHELSCIEVTF